MKVLTLLVLLTAMLCLYGEAMASGNAWVVYWEADEGFGEAAGHDFDELICFEAYFDGNGEIAVPEETEDLYDSLLTLDANLTLSLVNDVVAETGTVQKSKDFLKTYLLTEEMREVLLDEVCGLVDRYDLSGLEIDFENFKTDISLWEGFVLFLERLYPILSRDGVRLRVVMECQAPKYVSFPEGPEYICMCYNLYGYHSGPGPKADIAFLQECGERWKTVPGNVHMAFATGGFLWDGNTVSRAVTETEALLVLQEAGVEPQRDPESMAMTAAWDQKTLWYADGVTLTAWRESLRNMGYEDFDLFRLSGNEAGSLTAFLNAKSEAP